MTPSRLLPWLAALLLAAGLTGWGPVSRASAEEAVPEPEAEKAEHIVRTVRFESRGRIQMDVWLDGEPLGRTPFRAPLPVGEYFLTATGDAIVPLMQRFEVGPDADQYAILPVLPVTTQNYLAVSQDVFRAIMQNPENPHLLIAALYLTIDGEEAGKLLARADEALAEEDAALEALRARYHLRGGRLEEALRTASHALDIDGGLALAWRVRADILAELGNHADALSSANYAVVQEPFGWRNLRTRARIHELVDNERAAAQDRERADELYEALHLAGGRQP